jgi:hypothetical protein
MSSLIMLPWEAADMHNNCDTVLMWIPLERQPHGRLRRNKEENTVRMYIGLKWFKIMSYSSTSCY